MRPSFRTFRRGLVAASAATALTLAAATPASAAKIQYGISPTTSFSQSDYQLMQQANVDLVRTNFFWQAVQDSPGDCTATGGACNWASIDAAVGAAASNGIGTMGVITGPAAFTRNPPTRKSDIKAFGDYAGAAVERYGPGGAFWNGPYQATFGGGAPEVPVEVFQIWNEPSSRQFEVPVKGYGKMLKSASKAMYAASRQIEIVLGGMFPDTGPQGTPIQKYLNKLYNVKGIKKTFDAAAIHPYSRNPKGIKGQMNRARKTMNKAGDKKADIWATELGYSSNGPKDAEVGLKSEKAQANALKKSMKILKRGRGKWNLGGIIWFTWQDSDNPELCRFCRSAGLLEANGGQKPAYEAFKKAAG
jgi:hypothetical protein